LGWREHILPHQPSCPALAVQNRISLRAQPRRDENAVGQFGPLQLDHEDFQNIFSEPKTVPPIPCQDTEPTAFATDTGTACQIEESSKKAIGPASSIACGQEPRSAPCEDETIATKLAEHGQEDCFIRATDSESLQPDVVDQSEKSQTPPKFVPEKTNLTAAEQFELELESIRGVQMLEIGDPKGKIYQYRYTFTVPGSVKNFH
jgi:hypothetical protein